MSTADNLRSAKRLIKDPRRWCQRTMYRDKDGNMCGRKRAVSWCADAAVSEIRKKYFLACPEIRLLDLSAREFGYARSCDLNDSTDHPTVMKMFNRAIELEKAQSGGS